MIFFSVSWEIIGRQEIAVVYHGWMNKQTHFSNSKRGKFSLAFEGLEFQSVDAIYHLIFFNCGIFAGLCRSKQVWTRLNRSEQTNTFLKRKLGIQGTFPYVLMFSKFWVRLCTKWFDIFALKLSTLYLFLSFFHFRITSTRASNIWTNPIPIHL